MKQTYQIYLLLIILSAAISCTDNSPNPAILHASEVIDKDSAVATMLEAIDARSLSDEDRAQYGILLSTAYERRGDAVMSDTLITPSLSLVYNGAFTPWAKDISDAQGSFVESVSEKRCDDIFESRIPRVVQNWQGQQLDMYTGAYTRRFTFNLSYTFGGYTKKERREVDSSRFGH